MPFFEKHVFICVNRRADDHPRGSCAGPCSGRPVEGARIEGGPQTLLRGEAIRSAFKEALGARGLSKRIRANAAGCLDQCEQGPSVVVYPEQVWYTVRTAEDVQAIVEEHLIGGRPVERLKMGMVLKNVENSAAPTVPPPPKSQ